MPFDEALDLWAWLSSRKILDSAALESAVERRGKWVGSAKVSALLRITRSGAVSKAELRLHSLLHDAGLTSWDAGVTVTDERGVVGVVDLIFPSARLIVEVDGFLAHSSHRSFVEDRRRQNRLVAAGYTVLRFTWDDLTQHPTKVIATIRRHLPPGVGLRAAM